MVEVEAELGALLNPSGSSAGPIGRLESQKLHWARKQHTLAQLSLQRALDQMGLLSAQAQCLKRPVTSFQRFSDSSEDQALYVLWEPKNDVFGVSGHSSTMFGFLKVVRDRRLYLVDGVGKRYVTTPICVLDFFVHQSVQHQGKGIQLFNAMLEAEGGTKAHQCAFDKPSATILQFLAKNYGLKDPIWQPTSIVVFPTFFDTIQPEKAGKMAAEEGESQRPLTALERHRRSVNERYNGTPPSISGSTQQSPRLAAQRDHVGDIINQSAPQCSTRPPAGADTPQGRKAQRDYGHQHIW